MWKIYNRKLLELPNPFESYPRIIVKRNSPLTFCVSQIVYSCLLRQC